MAARTSTGSSCWGFPGSPGAGLRTHRMTKKPIMSMTRSAKVKIHSGHSSHSVGLHFLQGLAMKRWDQHGDTETRRREEMGLDDSSRDGVFDDGDVEVAGEAGAGRGGSRVC